MAYSTPFTQSFGSHSNMYSSLKTGGMPSMPYHMSSLGLGSLGMGSLDPMHPATMNYGAPCKISVTPTSSRCLQSVFSWRKEAEEGADHLHPAAAGRAGVSVPEDEVPGHLHAGGGRSQNKFTRVSGPGECSSLVRNILGHQPTVSGLV